MEIFTPRIDNLQDQLRRELDPKGVLEEEIFQSMMEAAANRRTASRQSDRYEHGRAFFDALRELREIQQWRANQQPGPGPRPPASGAGPRRSAGKVIPFPVAPVYRPGLAA